MAAQAAARVIDLESFRARRTERTDKSDRPSTTAQKPVIWVPVVVWMPLWRMVG